jgi:tagatose kinase
MPEIVTIGEILVEMMAERDGQGFTHPGVFLGPYPSGAPAIFIDQAAKMGATCGMIAKVGDDDFGSLNIARLRSDGVDVSQISTQQGQTTGTAFVTYFQDGSRRFIFHFPYSAAGQLSPNDVNPDYLADAKFLHIMGCSLSVTASMTEAIFKAVDIAKTVGARISFDPNIRPELLSVERVKVAFERMLNSCDVLLSGRAETLLLTGKETVNEAIDDLKVRGIEIIVLKNASEGAEIYSEEGYAALPAYAVEEIDPTGAGDIFDGTFVACLAGGSMPVEALALATAAGALGVTKRGPMEGTSTKEQLMRFIESGTPLQ